MNRGSGGIAALLLIAVVTGFAYVGARYWQDASASYLRMPVLEDCDLRSGACRFEVAGRFLVFEIEPAEIPLMQPLRLSLRGAPPGAAVEVEIRGLNMDMGFNRTLLRPAADGSLRGETILPVCTLRRMEWEAALRIDSGDRYEVPVLFHTIRQG